jgi:hypothetical protein
MKSTKLFKEFIPSYGMNKYEMGKSLDLKTFDTAVPQEWADKHPNLMDNRIIVWLYDTGNIFGRPVDLFPMLIEREKEMLKGLLQVYPPCNSRVLNKWYNEATFQATRDYIFDWQQVAEGRKGAMEHEVFDAGHKLLKALS